MIISAFLSALNIFVDVMMDTFHYFYYCVEKCWACYVLLKNMELLNVTKATMLITYGWI